MSKLCIQADLLLLLVEAFIQDQSVLLWARICVPEALMAKLSYASKIWTSPAALRRRQSRYFMILMPQDFILTVRLSFSRSIFSAIRTSQLSGRAYYCDCTRHSLKEHPCRCYLKKLNEKYPCSVRFYSDLALDNYFFDELLGSCQTHFDDLHIALKRSDGIFSYNFACVVDDIDEKVNEVVRGADLIEMTPIQKLLYRELKQTTLSYLHLPLIKMNSELKYSKQNHAVAALKLGSPQEVLLKCLKLLNQDTSFYKQGMSPEHILFCAAQGFELKKIPTDSLIVKPQT